MKKWCVFGLALFLGLSAFLVSGMAETSVLYFTLPDGVTSDETGLLFRDNFMIESELKDYELVDSPVGMIGLALDGENFVENYGDAFITIENASHTSRLSSVAEALLTINGPVYAYTITIEEAPEDIISRLSLVHPNTNITFSYVNTSNFSSPGTSFVMASGEVFRFIISGPSRIWDEILDTTGLAEGESAKIETIASESGEKIVVSVTKTEKLYENEWTKPSNKEAIEPFFSYLMDMGAPLEAYSFFSREFPMDSDGYAERTFSKGEIEWLEAPEGLLAVRLSPNRELEPVGVTFRYLYVNMNTSPMWVSENEAIWTQKFLAMPQEENVQSIHYRLTIKNIAESENSISSFTVSTIIPENGGSRHITTSEFQAPWIEGKYASVENGSVFEFAAGENLSFRFNARDPKTSILPNDSFQVSTEELADGDSLTLEKKLAFSFSDGTYEVNIVAELERIGLLSKEPARIDSSLLAAEDSIQNTNSQFIGADIESVDNSAAINKESENQHLIDENIDNTTEEEINASTDSLDPWEEAAKVPYIPTQYEGYDVQLANGMNADGEPLVYHYLSFPLSDGLRAAFIEKGRVDLFGFVDEDMNVVIPFEYEMVGNFVDGKACVLDQKGNYLIIDKENTALKTVGTSKKNGAESYNQMPEFKDGFIVMPTYADSDNYSNFTQIDIYNADFRLLTSYTPPKGQYLVALVEVEENKVSGYLTPAKYWNDITGDSLEVLEIDLTESIQRLSNTDSLGTIKVISNSNVRSGPGADFQQIGKVREGEIYEVIEQDSSGWYAFIMDDGQAGYVSPKMVEFIEM